MIVQPLADFEKLIDELVASNGPDPIQYDDLHRAFNRIAQLRSDNLLSQADLDRLRLSFGDLFNDTDNFQGRTYLKPLGYAGDYLVIDRFYQRTVSANIEFQKWDKFVQAMAPAQAVRNRKDYFIELISSLVANKSDATLRVLNLASGPCRDVLEAIQLNEGARLTFDCVDNDPEAIEYARTLLDGFEDRVKFYKRNVVRAKFENKYHLIWSAGLFDYFNDRIFVAVLKRIRASLAEGGEIVIGNFSECNPARAAMEFSEWVLEYRSADKLRHLAVLAGYPENSVTIQSEPTSVNLFLRIRKGK